MSLKQLENFSYKMASNQVKEEIPQISKYSMNERKQI